MADGVNPALKAVSDAVLAVAAQRSVEEVLQRLVDSARELAGARYAALGIPDGLGGFGRFLVSGMSEEMIEELGALPRTHGMLGAILEAPNPYLTDDIQADPRFKGYWPPGHPDMHSFLGVPIVAHDGVIGAFYLTDKEGAAEFSEADRELIVLLAAHAAIAITNARLNERSQELSMLSERNRLALELHDAVSQKLFSLTLTAESAGTLLGRDEAAAREQIERTQQLAREALEELRALIQELRPPDLERDGLSGALRKHVEVLRRLHDIEFDLGIADAVVTEHDGEVLRIAHEALHNALRHAGAGKITLRLGRPGSVNGGLVLEVADDGSGFDPRDPALRSRSLGLTSMEERAERIGGRLRILSSAGRGTSVVLEVPDG